MVSNLTFWQGFVFVCGVIVSLGFAVSLSLLVCFKAYQRKILSEDQINDLCNVCWTSILMGLVLSGLICAICTWIATKV